MRLLAALLLVIGVVFVGADPESDILDTFYAGVGGFLLSCYALWMWERGQ